MSSKSYGRIPSNPLLIGGLQTCQVFFECLVTEQNNPFLFHRRGTLLNTKPVEHFELCSSIGDRFELYIDLHNQSTKWIPPSGFKFASHKIYYTEENTTQPFIIISSEHVFQVPIKSFYQYSEADSFDTPLDVPFNDPTQYDSFLTTSYGTTLRVDGFPETLFRTFFFQQRSYKIRMPNKLVVLKNCEVPFDNDQNMNLIH